MMKLVLLMVSLFLSFSSCGNSPPKKGGHSSDNNSNNTVNNVSVDAGSDDADDVENMCGDGVVAGDELCDGDCPTDCDDGNACTFDVVEGSACQQTCSNVPLGCADDDGCCPTQCSFENDNDCSDSCGDGIVDDDELCDGDCPTTCETAVCESAELRGSAANCNAECVTSEITVCADDDGCCPDGCTQNEDNDCDAICGNDVVELGEVCDGNCPATCNDGNACTADSSSGSQNTCDFVCRNDTVNACTNGDGCCPANCDWTNDNDCPCTPQTCGQQGLQCGQATDGCGNPLNCGGCPGGQACNGNNQCVNVNLNRAIGEPCSTDGDCASQLCATQADDWRNGYCTQGCSDASPCPVGSHCGVKDAFGFGLCLDTCVDNSQCRADGYLCFDYENDMAKECFPAGTGALPTGSPCTGSWQCAGGIDGFCARNFPNGGMCTESCGVLNFCPQEAYCGTSATIPDICYPKCMTDADCRAGYECTQGGFFGDTCTPIP